MSLAEEMKKIADGINSVDFDKGYKKLKDYIKTEASCGEYQYEIGVKDIEEGFLGYNLIRLQIQLEEEGFKIIKVKTDNDVANYWRIEWK